MDRLLVVYHKISDSLDCTDGFGAAFAFWLKYRDRAEYLPAFYHTRIPLTVFEGRDVVFVDFAYPAEYMNSIFKAARSLYVLDHHKTSMLDLGTNPYAKIELHKCGSQMAWEHVFPEQPLPKLFHHIRDNDLGELEDPNTRAFIQHLRSLEADFFSWEALYRGLEQPDFYKKFIQDGQLLLNAHIGRCAILADSAFPIMLGGIKGLAVNANKFYAHDVGQLLATQCQTFGATFYFRPDNNVEFSLASIGDFDVEKIAYKYKGGGHKNASGFSIPITSFSSIVDLSSKNVTFYLSLQTYLEEFCSKYVPPRRVSDAVSVDVSQSLAEYLVSHLGCVVEELEIRVEVFNINEKTVFQHALYKLAKFLKLPEKDNAPRWYHRLFPYRIKTPISFNEDQISELLELSKTNDTQETKDFIIANLFETVKYSYEAYLLEDVFRVEVTIHFPNSLFFLKHTVEV